MTQSTCTAEYIDFGFIDAQNLIESHRHHGKSLVDLKKVDLAGTDAGPFHRQRSSNGWGSGEPLGLLLSVGKSEDFCNGFETQFFHHFFAGQNKCRRAIIQGTGVGRSDGSGFAESWSEGRDFAKIYFFIFFIFQQVDGIALALGDADRYYFVFEPAILRRLGSQGIGANGKFILGFAGNVELGGGGVAAGAHGLVVVGIGEAVFGEPVYEFHVAVFAAPTRRRHVVGDVAHTFHTARYHQIGVTQHDGLRAVHDGFHAGSAHFIDGGTRYSVGDSSTSGSLPGGGLAQIGGADVAHQHFLDLIGGNSGFGQRTFDGDAAQLRSAKTGQYAAKTSHWGTNGGNDEYFFHVIGLERTNLVEKVEKV